MFLFVASHKMTTNHLEIKILKAKTPTEHSETDFCVNMHGIGLYQIHQYIDAV